MFDPKDISDFDQASAHFNRKPAASVNFICVINIRVKAHIS